MEPSKIPPGTLSATTTAGTLLAAVLGKFDNHPELLLVALGLLVALALGRGLIEAWKAKNVISKTPPVAGLLLFVGLSMNLCGCATFDKQPVALKKVESDALACGAAEVQTTMKQLTPAVLDALAGDSPDWRAQLDGLKGAGVSALLCTVSHALYDALGGDIAQFASLHDLTHAIEMRLAIADNENMPLPTPTRRVLARGVQYLREALPKRE